MSYFDILLIRKIKTIFCYQMPTTELVGVFKNREIDITGNIISWFNAEPGQYNDQLHYIEFNELTPENLNYGKYTEVSGFKTKTQTGTLSLTENYNIFSINQPYNKGLHVSLETEMYKDIKCTYTDEQNHPEYYLNKVFKFSSVSDEGALVYAMQNPPVGSNIALSFDVLNHCFKMQKDSETPKTGIEINDNTLNSLVDNGNAFNDYFQFQYLNLKKILLSNDYHKRNRRKQNVKP